MFGGGLLEFLFDFGRLLLCRIMLGIVVGCMVGCVCMISGLVGCVWIVIGLVGIEELGGNDELVGGGGLVCFGRERIDGWVSCMLIFVGLRLVVIFFIRCCCFGLGGDMVVDGLGYVDGMICVEGGVGLGGIGILEVCGLFGWVFVWSGVLGFWILVLFLEELELLLGKESFIIVVSWGFFVCGGVGIGDDGMLVVGRCWEFCEFVLIWFDSGGFVIGDCCWVFV